MKSKVINGTKYKIKDAMTRGDHLRMLRESKGDNNDTYINDLVIWRMMLDGEGNVYPTVMDAIDAVPITDFKELAEWATVESGIETILSGTGADDDADPLPQASNSTAD